MAQRHGEWGFWGQTTWRDYASENEKDLHTVELTSKWYKAAKANVGSTDWYKLSKYARKASGYLLSASLPLQQAFERASLYSAPNSGKTALVIFQKTLLGKKIIHQPLFEMNAIKAGKWANGLKIASKVVGGVGVGLAVYDISQNGFTTSNSLDLAMSGLALSGVGTGIAGAYFLVNGLSILFTDKSIGQHIDSL